MTTSLLAEAIPNPVHLLSHELWGALFWGFLIAAIIWLLVWLFLSSDDEAVDTEADSSSPRSDEETASSATDADGSGGEKEDDVPTSLDTATAEEAASVFADDIASGNARQDDLLGIVYDSEPDNADDLKLIKGVAGVLEAKLHGFGVYKFKQIAYWTDTATEEFATRLSFKDRIYRDDWIAQAKKFHEEKYGERL